MEALKPGHYWKTPFLWEPGCPPPGPPPAGIRFGPVAPETVAALVGRALAHSQDLGNQHAVATRGEHAAAAELLALGPAHFRWEPDWWRCALTAQGEVAGFVLPVVFKDDSAWRDGHPQGTIFYMGVMPERRGEGLGKALVDEATRVFLAAGCWRIFCDTGTTNAPMVRAFRSCGYRERTPWQRPLD